MQYCSQCGAKVSKRVPEGDDRPRYVCDDCEAIHYQNPRVIVGVIPTVADQVLLCRRAIEPRKGFWTVPAGFLENGETTVQGAERETREEAGARVVSPSLYRLFDLPHINQVYMFYRAELDGGGFEAGTESLEAKLFAEQDIPWQELAFPVVTIALREFFDDYRQQHFPVRISDVEPFWKR